ncbi:Putative ABC transporter permease protein [Mycoavidus cysteinexigens]|uniref:Spermidine/putrescine transport system permease protein PotC n=1 Tax=Mycoavidus cysteinexigens TaxID=1553431 RepID=A0A2Z6EUK8_9BURK|nr:ABC transporter permease [Mycoavidus cysteinexigens]BBE09149.1 Putative ABC transporter permease protein [Mycoavidus cysteinexigens]GAM52110.1 spermidine Putrescine ABC transporter permease component potC [bacterium endosymbiont of Mortierella elongata FMR23-6]GLR01904.1 ABC transporter permease [Mycoavidus cysteinexigens]
MNAFKLHSFPGIRSITALIFLFLYTPIIVLVLLSFNQGELTTVWQGFGLNGYIEVWRDPYIILAAKNSFLVALIATLISTPSATLAALALWEGQFADRSIITTLISLPLLIPGIVVAVATLMLFSLIGLELSLFTVIIAHTTFCIPFAYFPIKACLSKIQFSLIDAAIDLYANPWQAFWRVTWPQLLPGIIAGALLAFVISMDDFIITYFIAGPGATTLPVYIFGAIKQGVSHKINAISTLILGISILFIAISYFIIQRGRK